MSKLVNVMNEVSNPSEFDLIKLCISSPEEIRARSHGEVTKPETINYRTYKPERDGLFCARIFGPIKDYECLCGKYKKIKNKGIVCERCGVEVTQTKVRRERMGHVDLAAPVAHIWFLKTTPSRIGLLLDMMQRDLERVLYYESFVVKEPGLTPLEKGQVLSEEQYYEAMDEYGEDSFEASTGAEVLRDLLSELDLKAGYDELSAELKDTNSDAKRKRIIKRLKAFEAFLESNTRPEWMILQTLPVIPPELRPLVPLEGGRFAVSDLNDLYRRVINRNNRLRRLMELQAPELIIRNERRMLQESVDALFDNGRRDRAIIGTNKRPLKSISDNLKGKQGRLRQNLLGKRVDYSGRSVIVVGPTLKLHQCGLPKKMALELFKPFIYSKLVMYNIASTLKAAKKMVEKQRPEVWDCLEEVIREHPVLLNRAPTLHRLGIQAFEPILIEGKAIQLHPLVCTAFNADFDGDMMAVHVPLSLEAQLEARVLMMSTNNILSPANGKPIIVPNQDIVLGIYYLSMINEGAKGEGSVFMDIGEVEHALEVGKITLQSKIRVRMQVEGTDADENKFELVETTAGRAKLGELLPKHPKISFALVNRLLPKKFISQTIDEVYRHCGQKKTVIFADRITGLGFDYACRAGISIGKDDLIIPGAKEKLVLDTKKEVDEFERQYRDGLITQGEKYNKVIDAWSLCTDDVASAMLGGMPENNSVYMMAHSGARGSTAQIKQLAGMRGLMSKPSGDIIETPITSNFKEGLSVLEYFNSTHGARKGLADTALKTANSGYLTRRLVDVAQDSSIIEDDCGTDKGRMITPLYQDGELVIGIDERIVGRYSIEAIVDPKTGKEIVPADTMIDETLAKAVMDAGIDQVHARSPITCKTIYGICAKCYGRDLARGTPIAAGETVGVIAAQSIGEPGTQLTMRTFHIGGAVQRSAEKSSIDAPEDGIVRILDATLVQNRDKDFLVINRHAVVVIRDKKDEKELLRHQVQYGTRLSVKDGAKVKSGQRIADWDPYTIPVISEKAGIIHHVDLIDGVSIKENIDDNSGATSRVVIDWKQQPKGSTLKPRLTLRDKKDEVIKLDNGFDARHFMSVGAIITVDDGTEIKAGDVIARIPNASLKTKDITGGLPRVAELFEARRPKDHAIISDIDGRVEFGRDYKTKRRIIVVPEDDQMESVEYTVPKGKHISVQEGEYVKRGDLLLEGNPVPQDILSILGVEALADYLVNEVQSVYRLQDVTINDKHIEVIGRQMLRKIQVQDPGDTTLLEHEIIEKVEFDRINASLEGDLRPAIGKPILQGITKASLQTRSFISAASFQETTRVLTEAAISGRTDDLQGLKENVIVGRLIPAGTGSIVNAYRHVAHEQDNEALDKKAAEAAVSEDTTVSLPEAEADVAIAANDQALDGNTDEAVISADDKEKQVDSQA